LNGVTSAVNEPLKLVLAAVLVAAVAVVMAVFSVPAFRQ
jgi:hypothetical protein